MYVNKAIFAGMNIVLSKPIPTRILNNLMKNLNYTEMNMLNENNEKPSQKNVEIIDQQLE